MAIAIFKKARAWRYSLLAGYQTGSGPLFIQYSGTLVSVELLARESFLGEWAQHWACGDMAWKFERSLKDEALPENIPQRCCTCVKFMSTAVRPINQSRLGLAVKPETWLLLARLIPEAAQWSRRDATSIHLNTAQNNLQKKVTRRAPDTNTYDTPSWMKHLSWAISGLLCLIEYTQPTGAHLRNSLRSALWDLMIIHTSYIIGLTSSRVSGRRSFWILFILCARPYSIRSRQCWFAGPQPFRQIWL
jgi:hypothetical protein